MTRWVRHLVAWLALFVGTVGAVFQLTYGVNTVLQHDPTVGRNNTEFQVQVVSFPASDTNFEETDLIIGNLHWHVVIQPPLFEETLQLVGFVPSSGSVYGYTVSMVDSTLRFVTQEPGNQSLSQTFNSRRLLWEDPTFQTINRRFQPFRHLNFLRFGAKDPNTQSHSRKLLGQGNPLNRLVSDVEHFPLIDLFCAIPGSFSCDTGGSANGATAAQIAQIQALEDFQLLATKQISNLGRAVGGIATLVGTQQQVLNNVNQVIKNQALQLNSLNGSIFALAMKQDADNAATQAAFTGVYNNMAAQGSLIAGYTDAQLKSFAFFMTNQTQAIINTTNSLRNSLIEARRQLLARSRDNTRLIKQVEQQVLEARVEKYLRRQMNKGIWQAINYAKSFGFKPYLDPNFPGRPPAATIPADIQSMSVDNPCFSFVNNTALGDQTGLHDYAHQICYNYQCSIGQALDGAPQGANYEDFMEFLGPTGCANTTSAALAKCKCWVTVAHKSCRVTNVNTFTSIPLNASQSAFTLVAGMCSTGTPQPDYWDGQLFTSIVPWHAFLGSICASKNVLGASPPYFVMSDAGVTIAVPSIPGSSACNMQMDLVFSTPGISVQTNLLTLPFAVYTQLQVGWKSILASNNLYEAIVYGYPPNDLTCTIEYFQQLPDNSTYTRHTCLFAAVAPTTVPVFEVVNTQVVDNILATAYDRAPVCNPNCIFGNVVEQTFTQTASYTVPKLPEAPQVGDIIYGILSATGTTSFYDNPRALNILIPIPSSQAGSPLYLLQPVPANFNLTTSNGYPATTLLDQWQLLHPFGYSALDAAFFINVVQTNLVSGVPVEVPGSAPQWMFGQLTDYTISPLTDMKHRFTYVIYPHQWGAEVALDVNLGPIQQTVYTGCAGIAITYYTDGTASYTLSDPWDFDISGFLRIKQVNNVVCGDVGDILFTLTKRGSVTRQIIPCGNQTFQVFQAVLGQNAVPCGLPIFVNSQLALANQVDKALFGGFNQTFVTDQIQTNAIEAITQANALQNLILPFFVPAILGPAGTFTPNQTISQAIAAFNQGLINQGKKPIFSNITAVQLISPYIKTFTDLANLNANLSKTIDALLGKADRQLANLTIFINAVLANMSLLQNASNRLSLANANLITALRNLQSDTIGSCPSCPDIIVLHDICCVLQNIGLWIGYAIMVILFAMIGIGAYYGITAAIDLGKAATATTGGIKTSAEQKAATAQQQQQLEQAKQQQLEQAKQQSQQQQMPQLQLQQPLQQQPMMTPQQLQQQQQYQLQQQLYQQQQVAQALRQQPIGQVAINVPQQSAMTTGMSSSYYDTAKTAANLLGQVGGFVGGHAKLRYYGGQSSSGSEAEIEEELEQEERLREDSD